MFGSTIIGVKLIATVSSAFSGIKSSKSVFDIADENTVAKPSPASHPFLFNSSVSISGRKVKSTEPPSPSLLSSANSFTNFS